MLNAMWVRLAAIALLMIVLAPAAHAQQQGVRARVVVELFTSQGCVQCPRANRLLGEFAREQDVLALTFPVGIWDYLGWRDTFAQPAFSERQRAYSRRMRVRGRFTPQLVFNGARQLSASDWDGARATYDAQVQQGWPAAAPEVSITRLRNQRVRVTVGARPNAPAADIWIVAYDPGPITVIITGGANIDRSIDHYNLATRIERLGSWNGESLWFERSRCLPECAVIVQEIDAGPILAAAYTGAAR